MPDYSPARMEISAPRQLLVLFGLVCIGLLLGGFASFLMITLTPGASLDDLNNGNTAFIGLLGWMQALGTFCLFALPALLFNLFLHPRKDYFYARKRRPASLWLLAILLAICALTATDLFAHLNEWIPISANMRAHFQRMEANYDQQMLHLLQLKDFSQYLISLLLIALLPALFEELLFRGTLQQILLKWFGHPFWAILVTSIVFSAIHMSYFGFLPRLFLGILMGYVFYFGKSIWLNIIIHFMNNGLVITLLYYWQQKKGSMEEAMHITAPFSLEILGLVALIGLFFLFRQVALKKGIMAHPDLSTQS
ncbi:MAG TPA: CPBP family intramembrane glutamic endopeptidase [Arachidicoccus sp.]|nr:CPBP family intramembrane glutamic endopeptidase [Arachidicoccus sp.]